MAGTVHVLGFEPGAEAGIGDLRLAIPEVGIETALNPEMVKKQFDGGNAIREIAPDIVNAHMESGDSMSFVLSFDYHKEPSVPRRICSVYGERLEGAARRYAESTLTVPHLKRVKRSPIWKSFVAGRSCGG